MNVSRVRFSGQKIVLSTVERVACQVFNLNDAMSFEQSSLRRRVAVVK
jgi:hypothetical protein